MRTKQYIQEINQYSSKLSKENQEKFDRILLKIRFSKIEEHDAEDFSHHCLDLFLQAEKENISIEEMLHAKNLEEFCNNFIQETREGYSFWHRMYCNIKYLPMILFLFTGIFEMLIGCLLKEWIKNGIGVFIPVTVSMLINTIVTIGIIEFFFIKAPSFYEIFNGADKRKNRIVTVVLYIISVGVIGVFVLMDLLFSQTLFTMNYFIFMGIVGGIWLLQDRIERRKED